MLTAALNVNGMLWATSPAVTELEQLTLDWLRVYPARLSEVTPEEVAAAALRFFGPSAVTGVVVGDANVIGPALRALGGVA